MFKFRRGDKLEEVAITITTETFIRLALLTVGTIVLLLAIKTASHALLLIFIAFFLALSLNAPVHWVSQRLPGKQKGSRSLATSIAFLIVVLALGGFIASITPPLVKQTQSFVRVAPDLVEDFQDQDSSTGRLIRKYNLEDQIDNFSTQLSERLKSSGDEAFSTLQKIGNSAFALLTILVLTFMMLVEGPRWLKFSRELTPKKHLDTMDRLSDEMYRVIKGFVNGQVILAALAAILIVPVILILGIPYPAALMVVVFICGLIPMVGHTIGAIIVTLVALFESPVDAVIILAYYILYQQLENFLIQPKIQANSTNMSPLLVFMAVVIGVSFGGLFGALVAIPVAGCLRIAVLEYLRHVKIITDSEYKEATTETK